MNPRKVFRDRGGIGALLDEYERSIEELKDVISSIRPTELVAIVDHQTEDENCRSVQTILSHVVSSGYNYAVEIRRWLGEAVEYRDKEVLQTVAAWAVALDQMFAFNEKLFNDYPDLEIEEYDDRKKITVRWGQKYDVEQLFEHAIVHILRHRRQIERFKIRLENV